MSDNFVEMMKTYYTRYGVIWDEVNLFGIRFSENQKEDVFNDILGMVTDSGITVCKGTTDPGVKFLEKVGGAAHLCLGYHKDVYMIGTHAEGTNFAHEAFLQRGNVVRIWRDVNKNTEQDSSDPVSVGYYGINIHRAARSKVENIGPYSAGCQVYQSAKEFEDIISEVKQSESYKKNSKYKFSYFLFDKSQVWKFVRTSLVESVLKDGLGRSA